MHILIIGAAGMVGRKLTEKLVKDGHLGGKPVDALSLCDVVKPDAPEGFTGKLTTWAVDISAPCTAGPMVAGRPDVIFHLAAIVSGGGRGRFRQGLPDQPRRHPPDLRGDPPGGRQGPLPSAPRLHLVDRRLWRTVP